MTRCPQCNEPWPAESVTCPRCGHPGGDSTSRIPLVGAEGSSAATVPDQEAAAEAGELRADTAMLLVQEGPAAGSRFLLDAEATTVGRSPDADILFDDVTVSRRHARFERTDGVLRLVDLGSLNGSYVNRTPVESATLADGDEVQIGKFRMIVRLGPTRG